MEINNEILFKLIETLSDNIAANTRLMERLLEERKVDQTKFIDRLNKMQLSVMEIEPYLADNNCLLGGLEQLLVEKGYISEGEVAKTAKKIIGEFVEEARRKEREAEKATVLKEAASADLRAGETSE